MDGAQLIRRARLEAGLTQAQLAERAGLKQPAIARLERAGSDPRVSTLARVLAAAGYGMQTVPAPALDLNQLRRHLAMTPAERLHALTVAQRNMADLRGRARRVA